MMRPIRFAASLLAILALVAVVVGIPVALVLFVGSPLPDPVPGLEELGDMVVGRTPVPADLVIGVLAGVMWLLWLQVAWAALVELSAAFRGRLAGRAPIMPGVQVTIGKLVTTATLLTTAFGARPVAAGPLPPVAAVTHVDETPADGVGDTASSGSSADGGQAGTASSTGPALAPYVTEAGDTWWGIAEATFGSGTRWKEIRNLNLGRTMDDGSVISVGTDLLRPEWQLLLPQPAMAPPTPAPAGAVAGREVVVEAGDTLWGLAEEDLAATGAETSVVAVAERVDEIAEINREQLNGNPDLIHPGQRIDLPERPPLAQRAPDASADAAEPPETGEVPDAPADASPELEEVPDAPADAAEPPETGEVPDAPADASPELEEVPDAPADASPELEEVPDAPADASPELEAAPDAPADAPPDAQEAEPGSAADAEAPPADAPADAPSGSEESPEPPAAPADAPSGSEESPEPPAAPADAPSGSEESPEPPAAPADAPSGSEESPEPPAAPADAPSGSEESPEPPAAPADAPSGSEESPEPPAAPADAPSGSEEPEPPAAPADAPSGSTSDPVPPSEDGRISPLSPVGETIQLVESDVEPAIIEPSALAGVTATAPPGPEAEQPAEPPPAPTSDELSLPDVASEANDEEALVESRLASTARFLPSQTTPRATSLLTSISGPEPDLRTAGSVEPLVVAVDESPGEAEGLDTSTSRAPLVAGLAAITLLGGYLHRARRRRRKTALQSRHAGRIPRQPKRRTRTLARRLAAAAEPEHPEFLNLGLRALGRLLGDLPTDELPHISGVWISHDRLVLALADDSPPCAPPAPFTSFADGSGWSLQRAHFDEIRAIARGANGPLPLLTTVGMTTALDLALTTNSRAPADAYGLGSSLVFAVDLEAGRVVSVQGPRPADVVETLSMMALELATSETADQAEIVCVGLAHRLETFDRVTVVEDLSVIVDDLQAITARAVGAAGDASPFATRVGNGAADTWNPVIVFHADPTDPEAQLLADLAEQTDGGVTAVCGYPTETGWTFLVDGDGIRCPDLPGSLSTHRFTRARPGDVETITELFDESWQEVDLDDHFWDPLDDPPAEPDPGAEPEIQPGIEPDPSRRGRPSPSGSRSWCRRRRPRRSRLRRPSRPRRPAVATSTSSMGSPPIGPDQGVAARVAERPTRTAVPGPDVEQDLDPDVEAPLPEGDRTEPVDRAPAVPPPVPSPPLPAVAQRTPNAPPAPPTDRYDDGADRDERVEAEPGLRVEILGNFAIGGYHVGDRDKPWKYTKTAELILYLLLHPGGASQDLLMEQLFPEQPPNRPRLNQLVSDARTKALGIDGRGDYHLPHASPSEPYYRLAPTVAFDLRDFAQHCAKARKAESLQVQAREWRAALELVQGRPFTLPHDGYGWALPEIEATIVKVEEAAVALADVATELGDHRLAVWATKKGLLTGTGYYELLVKRGRSALLAEDPEEIVRAFADLQLSLEHTGAPEEGTPDLSHHPELEDVYHRLSDERGRDRTS